jgi:2-keto-4-pentenoate hydratase
MTRLPASDPAAIAAHFVAARRSAGGLDAYPGTLPDTLEAAYAVQDAAIAAWGQPVIGWKIGRVAPPLSERFGIDRLAGPIFVSAPASEGAAMPVFAQGFAAGEAEFLLRIGRRPPQGQALFTLDEAACLIDSVHVGIEIASSPLASINRLGATAVISDFGNNNGLLVGPALPDWRSSGFEDWTVTTLIDDVEVGSGQASAFPDGTIGAARFLFELMAGRGIALEPGQWISSGAVAGVHQAFAGQTVEARFGDRHALRCRLTPALPAGRSG